MLKDFLHSLFRVRVPAAKVAERVSRQAQLTRYHERMTQAERAVKSATEKLNDGSLELKDFFTP